MIGFEPINYNVRENNGNAVVTVKVLSGSLSESVSVTLTTNDGSAGGVYCTVLYCVPYYIVTTQHTMHYKLNVGMCAVGMLCMCTYRS